LPPAADQVETPPLLTLSQMPGALRGLHRSVSAVALDDELRGTSNIHIGDHHVTSQIHA
jgi:hypothetical protein